MIRAEISKDFQDYNIVILDKEPGIECGEVQVHITDEFTNGTVMEEPYAYYIYSGYLNDLIENGKNDLVSDYSDIECGAPSKSKKKKTKKSKSKKSKKDGRNKMPGVYLRNGTTDAEILEKPLNDILTINNYIPRDNIVE